MYTIRSVDPVECYPKARDLIAANWGETGFDFDLDLDLDAYKAMCDAGVLFALAAFDGDDMVGYCTVAVTSHPFNRTIRMASNDALFVKPEYRAGLLPGRLMRRAEQEAKAQGASRFLWHCRAGTPLAQTLEAHGYKPVDVVVMKEI